MGQKRHRKPHGWTAARRLAYTDPDYDHDTYMISVVTVQRFEKPLIIGLGSTSKVLEIVLADLGYEFRHAIDLDIDCDPSQPQKWTPLIMAYINEGARFVYTISKPSWLESAGTALAAYLRLNPWTAFLGSWLSLILEVVFMSHSSQNAYERVIPSGKLLVYHIEEGLPALCQFLQIPCPDRLVPATPFVVSWAWIVTIYVDYIVKLLWIIIVLIILVGLFKF